MTGFRSCVVPGRKLDFSSLSPFVRIRGRLAAEEVKICDLVRTIAEISETKSTIEIGALPYRPTEIWRMYADATRAHDILGWKPAISLRDGLKQTVDWFRSHPAPRGND